MYYGVIKTEDYICHHGVKGQRWGVRKKQESNKKTSIKKLQKRTNRANKAWTTMSAGSLMAAGIAVLSGLSLAVQPFKHVAPKLITLGSSIVAKKLLDMGSKKMFKKYDRLALETTNAKLKARNKRPIKGTEWGEYKLNVKNLNDSWR